MMAACRWQHKLVNWSEGVQSSLWFIRHWNDAERALPADRVICRGFCLSASAGNSERKFVLQTSGDPQLSQPLKQQDRWESLLFMDVILVLNIVMLLFTVQFHSLSSFVFAVSHSSNYFSWIDVCGCFGGGNHMGFSVSYLIPPLSDVRGKRSLFLQKWSNAMSAVPLIGAFVLSPFVAVWGRSLVFGWQLFHLWPGVRFSLLTHISSRHWSTHFNPWSYLFTLFKLLPPWKHLDLIPFFFFFFVCIL